MTSAPLIYAILKEIEAGREPKPQTLNVSNDDFVAALRQADDSGYAKNIGFAKAGGKDSIGFANNTSLTNAGRAFIEEYERESK